ncbi:dienelactone hydrolase family protein [Enemella sp. A6]|uniref:dienelactone hydrolase family protein n=1 Tax=Enemella sp. A6 TaxID=3440152 RepID=UPI003EB9FD06
METVSIEMSEGACDALLWLPEAPRHAVLWCPDALGIRPANIRQCEKLAEWGVAVLMVNQFWRYYRPPFITEGSQVGGEDQEFAEQGMRNYKQFDFTGIDADAPIWAEYLAERSGLDTFSYVGFCMGGRVGIRVAAATGERCTHVTAFHPAYLIQDNPNSEHLLLDQVQCPVHFEYADDDPGANAEQRAEFAEAALEAGGTLTDDLHPGALHGFMMEDRPVYAPEAAARGWEYLAGLYRD